MDYDPVIASITLAGSLLSCIATACVLISFVVYHKQQRSFRHALVLNLTLAEFINSLNNSISGIIFARTHHLKPGAACVVNGLVGQLSVQASDFSILAIALVTFLTVTRTTYMPNASTARKILICLSVWVVPIITSITATAMGQMAPVSGNWCWISESRPGLRYALTHGWRFAIIFTTIAIYTYVWWYLGRHFRSMAGIQRQSYVSTSNASGASSAIRGKKGFEVINDEDVELDQFEQPKTASRTYRENNQHGGHTFDDRDSNVAKAGIPRVGEESTAPQEVALGRTRQSSITWSSASTDIHKPNPALTYSSIVHSSALEANKSTHPVTTGTVASEFPMRRETRRVEREIKRMMLLNAYPIMYVLLWIPGLVNRLMEASGHTSQSKVLAALQSSSQFIGFANALTYGFNQHIKHRIKADVFGRWTRKG